jgi:Enoyl-(Acyl carrier protein) reductase
VVQVVAKPSATELPKQARWQADPGLKARTAAAVPLGRVGTTQDMANACLFVPSDRAAFISGTELLACGWRADGVAVSALARPWSVYGVRVQPLRKGDEWREDGGSRERHEVDSDGHADATATQRTDGSHQE